MKPFLKEVAEVILARYPKPEDVTVVFPNRRATLFFRKFFSELIHKPVFSPKLLTIEDFIGSLSHLNVVDKLELVTQLYHSYIEVVHKKSENNIEPFDKFYFWGEMLLRDFDEIDKYLVNASHLFKDLSHQKILDTSFDYLTEEQLEFLRAFWGGFDENVSANKKKFLHVWRELPGVYEHFKSALQKENMAFEGMLQRDVAESITRSDRAFDIPNLVFAGFNALTKAEEVIISYFVDRHDAHMFWDIDEYYVNNEAQEAGNFFREYQEHKILKNTFSSEIPANLLKKRDRNTVKVFGAPQPVGQAKLLSEVLQQHLKGEKPEETLIVLPDEKLLLPVLHGVAGVTELMNVTMGFPLTSTPLFNLIEIVIDLQLNVREDEFNHRQVLAILGHPYVITADAISANNKRKEILKHNWVSIPAGFLGTETALHRKIFRSFLSKGHERSVNENLVAYLREIVSEVGHLENLSLLDKEFAFQFLKFLNRIQDVFTKVNTGGLIAESAKARNKQIKAELKSFLRLFRQLMSSNRIPFSGEPLRGLQLMGVLETRNLDFKNVFILSLNEGAFPSNGNKGSYIPYNIRKAYRLPTVEQQDAMYAYLFYRVIQRAENVFLFYNSETDVLGQGEMSRYLQQLIYESGIPVERKILHNPVAPLNVQPLSITKDKYVLDELMKLNDGNVYFQGISPSALNTYIECRLKFYLRHVAKIKEPNEVEEELDARVLGNFLHEVMENFYRRIIEQKNSHRIEASDFDHSYKVVEELIDKAFIEAYRLNPDAAVTYEGQRLVVKEVVKRFAHRILEMDKRYSPFTIEALEQGGLTYTVKIDHPPYKAVISGKIDRIDRKDDLFRIIDYKTGKDTLNFETIPSLFSRDTKRNKAAFQTLLYALLYRKNQPYHEQTTSVKIVPGLINRINLFDDTFTYGLKQGKEIISDANALLPEFESEVKKVFNDLYNPAQPFDQTGDLENCKLCPYSQLCYR